MDFQPGASSGGKARDIAIAGGLSVGSLDCRFVGAMITPIVKRADQKGLSSISAEVKALAARAREGQLKPAEFQGGSFSISNLGMYGVRSFSAISNPPQSCILAVGVAESRPVVRDGVCVPATMMSCTLSVDHRAVDGAVGAQYMAAFKALIEQPLRLML